MSATNYKQRYLNALMDLLWRQWRRLGVAGQMDPGDSPYVLDPEALLLFSSRFCRYDQRLYDLVIDWLRQNGAFINIQRLKSLAKKADGSDWPSLGFMAAKISDRQGKKWQKLAHDLVSRRQQEPCCMFWDSDQLPVGFQSEVDEDAMQYGLVRNPYLSSAKVTPFPMSDCATVLLQLRGVFGLSARAETVLVLLNREAGKIQDIADHSGYAWKSIQDVLTELCATPLAATHGAGKRGRSYFLTAPEKIKGLFPVSSFRFPHWLRAYEALAIIWTTVANPRLASLSEQSLQSEMLRIYDAGAGEMLFASGIDELRITSAGEMAFLPERLARV